MAKKYYPPCWSVTERHELYEFANKRPSFARNVIGRNKKDYTDIFFGELAGIINSPFNRNFVLHISGGIGRQMGVFKTVLGCQLGLKLFKQLKPNEHLAFTYNELNDLVKKFGKRNQIFILDEKIRDLKQSAIMRLSNTIESCRESGLSFILIGVPDAIHTVCDYELERLGESDDKYLPKKTIYYSLAKNTSFGKFYMGYVKWNITPLSNKKWKSFWEDKYMPRKLLHQERVKNFQVSGFDFIHHAEFIMNTEDFYSDVINENKKLKRDIIKNKVYQSFPDLTNDERKMVYSYVIDTMTKKIDDIVNGLGA